MKNIIVAVAVAMTLVGSANAIDWQKPELGVGIYNVMPQSSDFKDSAKSGMGLNLSADWQLQDAIMIGAELGYGFGQEMKAYPSVDIMHTMLGVTGKYVKPMDFGSKKGNVYGLVGLGYYMWSTDPSDSSSEENEMGFSLGGGLNMEMNSNMSLGFELRYHMVSYGSSDANFIAPMLKLGYKF